MERRTFLQAVVAALASSQSFLKASDGELTSVLSLEREVSGWRVVMMNGGKQVLPPKNIGDVPSYSEKGLSRNATTTWVFDAVTKNLIATHLAVIDRNGKEVLRSSIPFTNQLWLRQIVFQPGETLTTEWEISIE